MGRRVSRAEFLRRFESQSLTKEQRLEIRSRLDRNNGLVKDWKRRNEQMQPGLIRKDDLEVIRHEGRELVSRIAYDDLRSEYDALLLKFNQARDNGAMLDAEKEYMKGIKETHGTLQQEMDKLTLYVREQFKEEIGRGLHGNMKTSVDAAIYYLGKYIEGGKK